MKSNRFTCLAFAVLVVLTASGILGCVPSQSPESASLYPSDLASTPLGSLAEGTKDGGGGIGVLCHGSLRTLDLYEAEEVHHYKLDPIHGDLDENLKIYQARMAAYFSEKEADPLSRDFQNSALSSMHFMLMDRIKDIPPNHILVSSHDATLPKLKPECSFVQIILYQPDGLVLRDRKLWDRLTAQNQAAILLHEELYEFARGLHERTSDNTRQIVGMTFAKMLPRPIFENVWNAKRVAYCLAGRNSAEHPAYTAFAIEQEVNGQMGVAFYFIMSKVQSENSQASLGKLTAFMPEVGLDQLVNADFSSTQLTVHDELFGKQNKFQIQSRPVSPQETILVNIPGLLDPMKYVSQSRDRAVRFTTQDDEDQMPLISDGFCNELDGTYPLRGGSGGIGYLSTFIP